MFGSTANAESKKEFLYNNQDDSAKVAMSRELLDATGAVFKNAGNGDCFFMALSQHLVLEEKWHPPPSPPPPLTIFFYRINFQFGKILPYKIFSLVTALPYKIFRFVTALPYKIFRFVTALPYSPGGLPKPDYYSTM